MLGHIQKWEKLGYFWCLPLLSLNSLQNKILVTSVPVPLKIAPACMGLFCDSCTKWYWCRSGVSWRRFCGSCLLGRGQNIMETQMEDVRKETLVGRRRWHCLLFLHTNSFKEKEEQGKLLISCEHYNGFQRCVFSLAKFLIKLNIFSGCRCLNLTDQKNHQTANCSVSFILFYLD